MSYPNKEDELRARKNRWAPGGSIMIHGFPNQPKHPASYYRIDRLDGWLHRSVQLRHGRSVDAHSRQYSDRYLSIKGARVETTILSSDMVDARVAPKGSLEHLSQQEIAKLLDSGQGGLYPLFRKCALAVLNSGSDIDDTRLIFEKYRDFDLRIVRQAWGIKLEIKNAPAAAFVDGVMIRGLKDHLFAVLRDVVFISNEIMESGRFDLRLLSEHHQRRISHLAQCASSGIADAAESGGVLGRPLHPAGRIRLHQEGRL